MQEYSKIHYAWVKYWCLGCVYECILCCLLLANKHCYWQGKIETRQEIWYQSDCSVGNDQIFQKRQSCDIKLGRKDSLFMDQLPGELASEPASNWSSRIFEFSWHTKLLLWRSQKPHLRRKTWEHWFQSMASPFLWRLLDLNRTYTFNNVTIRLHKKNNWLESLFH